MEQIFFGVAACVLFGTPGLFAQGEQVFKGQITQCTCAVADQPAASPSKGKTAVACPPPCANAGPIFVLVDSQSKIAYPFDKQDLPKAYGPQEVFVIGVLDKATGAIRVHNIVPDVAPRIKRAKTVAIVCDACPRAMAKAKKAAFEELTVWKRFTVLPDPKKADLIFLFSANRYLGDYLTRGGPDKRPVHIDFTYFNVLDPRTGESLWGDYDRLGSWFVGTATKDLIDELREMLEADVNPAERQSFLIRHHIPKAATDVGK
jgi:hypothetical protein